MSKNKEEPKSDDEEERRDGIKNLNDINGTGWARTYQPGVGFHRYDNALKNLIPVRPKGKEQGTMAVDSAGLVSVLCFSWISDIMYKAYTKGIKMEELPDLSPYDTGSYNAERLELIWKEELTKRGPEDASFSRAAWRFCRTRVLAACFVFACSLISGFLSYTYVMRKLLEYVESKDRGPIDEGIKWTLLLIFSEMCRTLFLSWSWTFNYRTAVRLRSACLTMLYGKITRMDNLGSQNIGKVINIFTNDAHKVFEMIIIGPMIVGAPISTVFGIFFILWLLGPMALIGMIVFLLYFPLQYMMSRLTEYFQEGAVQISDLRVRLMNEILDCIKLIKMYAWEKRFSKELLDTRETERQWIIRSSYCRSFGDSLALAIPVISATISFLAHTADGSNLTAAQVFPYTTFLDSGLRLSMYFFQDGIYSIISARISFNRMKSMLLVQDGNCSVSKPILKSQAVTISNGTFAYNTFAIEAEEEGSESGDKKRDDKNTNSIQKSEQEKLNNPTDDAEYVEILFEISFEAEKGKLVGICGQVGSGKSSLLLAALGQLRVSEGQVARDGSCAYVSQQAWITNATLKDNILFGSKFDHSRYHKVIYACSLIQDIEMMPGGDQTEIGEKGVNLSGGQKQRVALARALYADRDIYFLDDPLSAVDSRVGAYIFENLILGALKGKTILFVTHQIQYLNRCDDIYMMRDGKIIEHGTHDELMELDNEYASMVAAISAESEDEDEPVIVKEKKPALKPIEKVPLRAVNLGRAVSVSSHVSAKSVEKTNPPDAQLTVAEDLEEGTIKAQTYHLYIMAAGGYFTLVIVILMFIIGDISITFSSWWLAHWIEHGRINVTATNTTVPIYYDNINNNPHSWYYKSIYGSIIAVIVLSSALRTVVYAKATIRASTMMHNDLFKKIITSPMRFFDTTPSGRIQHLFSRDMDEVDNKLPSALASVIECSITILSAVLIICLVFPWSTLLLCILGAFYYYVSRIFRVAIRDLKRLDNKARSLVISFVTASVQGLSTIHAFGKENDFMTKFLQLFDQNSKCLYLYNGALRWLAIRIDALSVGVTGITAVLVVILRNEVAPALAGLALSYSALIADLFQYTIRIITETEVRLISVERINQYNKTLVCEGSTKTPTIEPPPTWPAAAEIKFSNVCMAYGEDAPFILKKISFTINAGEQIGIVGRTGSGKSSLTVALFRLVEIAQGKIEIDDIDISQISLNQLRMKLSIIPQDPVLFSGTIRSNLDPFNLYTDVEIWNALEKTELKERVQSITGQLDASVGFGGDNMSVGERQLLCLARALLRNSKILILDEATAAVDPETELAVQNTIQQAFSSCTILTIAHRLQTVLSLNRVLVMDNGEVLEFDTPSNLLGNPDSELSKMVAATERAEGQ